VTVFGFIAAEQAEQAGITGMDMRRRGRTTIRVPGVRVREDLVVRSFLAAALDRLRGR
jgi:hypothetical protein